MKQILCIIILQIEWGKTAVYCFVTVRAIFKHLFAVGGYIENLGKHQSYIH